MISNGPFSLGWKRLAAEREDGNSAAKYAKLAWQKVNPPGTSMASFRTATRNPARSTCIADNHCHLSCKQVK